MIYQLNRIYIIEYCIAQYQTYSVLTLSELRYGLYTKTSHFASYIGQTHLNHITTNIDDINIPIIKVERERQEDRETEI